MNPPVSWRNIAVVVLGASAVLVVSATPAAAHGIAGLRPSNYETRIVSVRPKVAGVSIRVVDLGNRLELRNSSSRDVIVRGYDDEPYLRVGPDGVFENRRSPATYLNRSFTITGSVPRSADSSAPPEWHRIGDPSIARWHDHRAHWMGTADPPEVGRDPGQRHLVQRWVVTLTAADATVRVRGEVLWIPGTSGWPWFVVALACAIAVVAVARRRHGRAAGVVALAVLAASELAHVVGQWDASTATFASKLGASAYSLGGVALAGFALLWLARRGTYAAGPVIVFAGILATIAGGLGDLGILWHSQLPTTVPAFFARLQVALALGLGAGLTVVGWRWTRRGPRRPSTRARAVTASRSAAVTS